MSGIKKGDIVTARKKITGMVVSHEIGAKLKIISVWNNRCTLEAINGVGCIVGVPLSHVELVV